MATLTFTLAGQCSGGNHLRIVVTGTRSGSFEIERDDLTVPDRIDKEQLFAALLRLIAVGKTAQQIRTALQAGVTITIG